MKNLRKRLKKATAIILVLALTVTSINVSAFADVITGPVIYNGSSFDTIEEALVKAREDGNKNPAIYLNEDIDFGEIITLTEDEKVTISSYTDSKVTINLTSETADNTSFTVKENCTLTFENVDIQGNYIETTDSDGNTDYSRAYDLKASPFVVNGSMVLNNATVKNYSYSKPIIELNNAKLDMAGDAGISNVELGYNGTLISSTGTSCISGGTITGMDGYKFGYPAAIKSNDEESELKLDSVTFDNNLSGFAEGYKLILKNCTVSNNNDVNHYISATYGYMDGCTFKNNSSYYSGTVKFTYGEIFNSDFTKQKATTGTACVYLENADVTLGGNKFHENSLYPVKIKNSDAKFVSGKVNSTVFGDEFEVGPNIFENNSTSAVYVETDGKAVINQANFIGNSTKEGAAIYNNGTVSLYNATFSENKATGENSNNTNKVTRGDAVYNNGTLYLYSAVNFGDNNIYEMEGSRLIVKEDLLMHSETNKINIALEKTVESSETAIAKYETENSEESAYQSVLKKTWNVESVSAKKNETMAAKGDTIVFNADTLDQTITFVNEKSEPVSGVVYEITKKSNGKTVSLGYTEASDENGQITISGMYDGNYTATLVSTPSSVEGAGNVNKINFTVDTDNNTVTSGGYVLADDFSVALPNFNPPPIAVISLDRKKAKINEEISFDASGSSDDTKIAGYKWTFSDGTSSTGEKVTHSFTKEGTYTVTLTVKDSKGKSSTQTCKVVVQGTFDNQYKLTVNVMKSNDGSAVSKATVEVINDNGKSTYVASDENGVAEIYVNGNSSYTVKGYADGYYYKTLDVYMQEEGRSINLYLSDLETIVGEMTVERITAEEAAQLGVDTDAEENQVYYKQETEVSFSYDMGNSWAGCGVTIIQVLNGNREILKELIDDSDSTYKIKKIKDGFYFAVQCDVTWMSEMFDVQLIVLNNSSNEEIQNCEATLNIPAGLSLAKMSSGEQTKTVNIGTIPTGGSHVQHWMVKGDSEGTFELSADVSGEQVSTNDNGTENRTKFEHSYACLTPIKVLGGNALNLFITGQSSVGNPYYMDVQYALVNVSDINIYGVELAVSKGDTYGIGSKDDILDENNNVISSKLEDKTDIATDKVQKVDVLEPGDAAVVCTQVYIGGSYTNKEYCLRDAISSQIGGNMKILTISQFQFISSRYSKSTYENSNVHESSSADPVDMLTGAFMYERSDATIRGLKDFSLTRKYSSSTGTDGVYGYGWRDDFTYYLQLTENGDMNMNFPNGDKAYFEKLEDGSYASAAGSELSLEVTRANNSTGSVVEVEGSEDKEGIPAYTDPDFTGATVTAADGTVYTFNKHMKVSKIVDVEGYTTTYGYNGSGYVTKVSTNTGSASFTYDSSNRITKVTMSSGETVSYGYDDDGYLNKITNADGDTMYYSYDSNGYIVSVTDFLGNECITNEYDDYGRVIKQYVQGEGTYEFTYDDAGKTNTCTGENGYVHTIKYDDLYRITEDTENGTTTYKYDDNSWLLSETDSEGNKTSYEYDSLGRVVKIVYRDVNAGTTHTEEYKYDVNGKIVESINKNGAHTYYVYDEKNRLVTLKDDNGNETNYVYDDRGNVILEVHGDGGVKSYTYDSAGRKLSETDETGNGTVYEYDSAGRTLSITASDGSSKRYTYSSAGKLLSETDANGNTKTYTVNANGYTTAVTYGDGTAETTTYNEQNKTTSISDRIGKTVGYTYDAAGNVATYKTQRGFKTSYTYDANRQLITVKNVLGKKWNYAYDTNGNVTKVTDPLNGTAATTYDANGNVLTYTDENGAVTTYEYDGVGNVISSTDAEGNTTTYRYDANNNVVEVKNAMGDVTTYTYDCMNRVVAMTDALGQTTGYTYDYKGQVKSETDAKGNTKYYEYDSQGRVILEKDALGQTTAYTYDNNGNVTSVVKPNGGTVTYTYDADNNRTSVTDERGYKTGYTYGPTGLLTKERNARGLYTYYTYNNAGNVRKITYPDKSWVEYEYDGVDRLTKTVTSDGRTTEYVYDALGRVSTETAPDGSVKTYTYDSVGNVLSVTDGDGYTTSYEYDALGQVTSVTDPNSGVVRYEYDANGNVVSETDANGNRTTHTYDGASRLKSTTDANGNSKTYSYDSLGNVTSVTDESGNETKYEYDELSRLVKTTNAAGETTEYEYDSMGNVVKEIRSDGKYKEYVYDLAGNLTSEKNYRGRKTRYYYDKMNNVSAMSRGDYSETYTRDNMGRVTMTTYHDGSTEEYTYDNNDNVTGYKDRNGNVTTYVYDSMNNMIQSTDAEGAVTDYEYDINGNVTKQTLHRTVEGSETVQDEVTTYTYDGCGNPVTKTDALGNTTTYAYDLNGNLVSETDDSGKVIKTYTYDALNRVSEKSAGNKTTTYMYNNTGAVTAITSSDNEVLYERDSLDRIISSTQNGRTTTYTYNVLGQKYQITYPDGSVNKIKYNENGRLSRTDSANGMIQYTFDADDNITSKKTRNSTVGDEEDPAEELESYTYDVEGRMLTKTYSNGENTVVTDEYTYDYNGNVTGHIERDVKTGRETKNTYTYDALNRLKTENKEENGKTAVSTSYEYDSVGNLVKETTDGSVTTYVYNNLNQLTEKTDGNQSLLYRYDGNGALSLEGDAVTGRIYKRYTNDENGRMLEATSYTYTDKSTDDTTRTVTTATTTKRKLDDNGYVTEETTDIESFLTVGDMTILQPKEVEDVTVSYVYDYTTDVPSLIESRSTDGTVVDYIYSQGRTGAVVTNKNGDDGNDSTDGFKQKYNLSTDKNKTTVFATDREGNVVAETDYDTWAEVTDVTKINVSDTINVDITSSFTGYVYNEVQKLWNAGERVYSAEMKHFTSMDPEPGNVYEKMRVNPYVYAGNNPATYVDPDGRSFADALGKFGNAIDNGLDWLGDRASDAWKWITDTAGSAWDAITGTFSAVACALKSSETQMAVKLLIGTLGLAIGIAATAITGGSAFPVIGYVAGGSIVGGLTGMAGYAVSNAVNGEEWNLDEFKEAGVNGFVDGYMWSGVTATAQAIHGWYQTGSTTAKYVGSEYHTGTTTTEDVIKGGACFVEGTKVLTDDGYADIEDIEQGDYVLAENPETGEQEYKEVTRTFTRETDTIVHVHVGDEEIETTEEHPFYVEETGWVAAGDLKEGDVIRTSEGENISISKVETEKLEETVSVYNFEVEDYHTYYVSESSVLVHNKCWQDVESGSNTVKSNSNNIVVTEEVIRNAMKDAPLKTQQKSVSIPVIQEYVNRVLAGEVDIPDIKVDGDIIVDGNHRYITSRITGTDVGIKAWCGGKPDNVVDWADVILDPFDWGNR